jgi:triphosphoribosyl-dephospho-CoA synthase
MRDATARLALRALHTELMLYPKPGLVSPRDSGSHADMDAATFMRSLFSLRHYFAAIEAAGMDGAPFGQLRTLGMAAEARMLAATNGINTHRGAIFSLGLLCAAHGWLRRHGHAITPEALRAALLARWGDDLARHRDAPAALPGLTPTHAHGAASESNGLRAARLYGAGGAREQAAQGLPAVFDTALPALRATLARGGNLHEAHTEALFALMASLEDTNVLHRGGADGDRFVRIQARRFIALGGTANPHWRGFAHGCHILFVRHRLSPGGAADLLAAASFVHAVTQRP